MSEISNIKIEEMIKNGVHYGFMKTRRNPTTKKFIQTTQNGLDFINVKLTKDQIEEAVSFLKEIKSQNKKILFICEKVELSQIVKELALSLGEAYVVNRFIGGTLTNFFQIKKRIEKLHKMLEEKDGGLWNKYTKKEQVLLQRELAKLDKNFGGISSLNNLPGVVVLVDSKHEEIPLKEANISGIPVISLSNTDCDISSVDYPIICNDSSRSSVNYILSIIKDSLK